MYLQYENQLDHDLDLLTQTIRLWAHWLDKYRDHCPRPVAEIQETLTDLLKRYHKNHFPHRADIIWAEAVLKNSQEGESPIEKWTTFFDVVRHRRSARSWLPQPVPPSILTHCLELGLQAPSSGNMQAVRYKVVDQPDDIASVLKKTGHPFQNPPPVLIIVGVDSRLYTKNGQKRMGQDVMAVGQTLLLAATAYRLGSCYLSNAGFDRPSTKTNFGIPNHILLMSGIGLGFVASWPREVPKITLESALL